MNYVHYSELNYINSAMRCHGYSYKIIITIHIYEKLLRKQCQNHHAYNWSVEIAKQLMKETTLMLKLSNRLYLLYA